MSDMILDSLKDNWSNISSHIQLVGLELKNLAINEREGDEPRRKVAEEFLELLKNSMSKIKPEIVRTETGYGVFLDYGKIFHHPFSILFYIFENNNPDFGYWDQSTQEMTINITDYNHLISVIKSKNFIDLFNKYQSTIFHEIIHMHDHSRYKRPSPSTEFQSYMNNYAEFEAFYQQYARSIDKIVRNIKTISNFYTRFGVGAGGLISDFWSNMPDEMKRDIKSSKHWTNKWNKRLYQLYYEKLKKFKGA